ncbi:hypothetical protein SAMN04487895_104270 [Paenibacillus sophorae]|uniref:Uncharacterized protein n=1 Tax=Paenibacillus sophorae TaxID=1333845 RepID=A0A1H8LBS0_9BACL|nr:hypothetical protein [Paenibacillus sophorae]QWU17346.1 hypothetical protein KP014_09440 [Paenibacillus sophorae]SEO02571.1 hypothetical protein SAMN04487895_104270 [Paenibacillus sophorae]
MQIIQRLTVLSTPNRIYEVGSEIDGHEVISIKQVGQEFENSVHSEFLIEDENGDLIASVENAPAIVDWKTIAEHDEEGSVPT